MQMNSSFTLTIEGIKQAWDEMKNELSKDRGFTEQSITAVLLIAQEIILFYRNAFGEQRQFRVESRTKHRVRIFEMRFAGDELDPDLNESTPYLSQLPEYGFEIPRWSYEDGWNVITIIVPRTSTTIGVLKFCLGYAKGEKSRL